MFYLDLEKDDGTVVSIKFQENNTSLGKKWATKLKKIIDNKNPVGQPHRIYNLNNQWNEASVIKSINNCIEKINAYKPTIDYYIDTDTMSQNQSNKLHHYFEILRGENDDPNQFYDDAPKDIKLIIDEYNVLIHRWEDLGALGRVVVHFKNRPMYKMEDEDFDAFTMRWKPGDVRLNYCHKGKPLYDVYKDADEDISGDNITPQSRYSADFNINFDHGPGLNVNFMNWWIEHEQKLNSLGFNGDKRMALGWAVIGRIIGDPGQVKQQIIGSTTIIGARYD